MINRLVTGIENILIEAEIALEGVSTVEPAQDARIALTAFDPARYGYLFGKINEVPPDTVFHKEAHDKN